MCDNLVNNFNLSVTHILDDIAPVKTKIISGKSKAPWRNVERVKALKRTCRKFERKWRKTKLQADHILYKDLLSKYNKEIKTSRQHYFSQIISENLNNSKFLFSTIDKLINPLRPIPAELHSSEKCNKFASYFKSKIINIRNKIMASAGASDLSSSTQCHTAITLSNFAPIQSYELQEVVQQLSSATCALDPMPTKLFKSVLNCLVNDVLEIVNTSLLSGIFPMALKHAIVIPLLKKSNLDPFVLENYRPISNLPFLGKILEKVVYQQLNMYLSYNNFFDVYQSGFRVNHSTETALVRVVNDLKISSDNHKVTVLVLLDLSAAFDTVDHGIPLKRLEHCLGLRGTVLNWLSSYLTGRSFSVAVGNSESDVVSVPYGVPQGSILGPLLFNLYMLPLGSIIQQYNISYQSYADDTQLYISVSANHLNPVNDLIQCITEVKYWMAKNFLQLNEDKTEILFAGPKALRHQINSLLTPLSVKPCEHVKNLGVILDADLNFHKHISSISKTAFYHLRNISKVRSLLSQSDSEKLVHAFISSRLDYCNGLFAGLAKQTLNKLQLIQNAAARVLTRTRRCEHITPVLISLHWLPVKQRIDFKILLIVFKAMNGLAPSYVADMLSEYTPDRPLRSSNKGLLTIPRINTKSAHGAFSHYGPTLWNSLPHELRSTTTVSSFKSRLKTYLFSQAFS